MDTQRFVLVYQSGIANLFRVASFNLADFGRDAVRVYQGDFKTAAAMARGVGVAGGIVRTASCNVAGDCSTATWVEGVDGTPFRDDAVEVKCN